MIVGNLASHARIYYLRVKWKIVVKSLMCLVCPSTRSQGRTSGNIHVGSKTVDPRHMFIRQKQGFITPEARYKQLHKRL